MKKPKRKPPRNPYSEIAHGRRAGAMRDKKDKRLPAKRKEAKTFIDAYLDELNRLTKEIIEDLDLEK